MIALAIALVVASSLALALRFYMDRDAENRLRAGEDNALAGFAGPVPENGALACPPGYCGAAGVIPSPVFAFGVDRLIGCWRDVLGGEPRVTLLARHDNGRREVVLQRSAMLHFPDVVTVEFVLLGPERSSLAIYSRARYGRADFGVNKARIERLLARLKTLADGAQ